MRIIILVSSYPNIYNQNLASFVQNQVQALGNKGLEVSVIGAVPISFKDIFKKRLFRFGLFRNKKKEYQENIFLFPSIPKLKRFNSFIRTYINKKLLKNYLLHNEVSMIHVHNSLAAHAALWVKKKFHIPYIVTEHSSAYARNLMTQEEIEKHKEVYENANDRVAVSRDFCKLLENIYNLKFKYIPNAIDTHYFQPANKKDDIFTFINIAYLDKNKNQALLIDAFYEAFKNSSKVNLHIVGSGVEYANLKKQINQLKMKDRIKLLGFATKKEVLVQLQNSDCFVLTSKYETFGVVLIEAMSCGLPVISTKCGGAESIITKDFLGLLVENNDREKLLNAMLDGYNNRDKYDSKLIRNYCIENFSQESIAKRLLNLYKKTHEN